MTLHPRLAADTFPICQTPHAHVLLMNDARWPWIILVPRQAGVEELHDLTHTQRDLFMADVNQASRVVQLVTGCQSVNVAMLGNVVAQLHCHVVARNPDDPNWPAPIWGFETAVPYKDDQPAALMEAIAKSFG